MQNFLELIWLLHVIVCAVFLGFRTKKSKLACYYLNDAMQNFMEPIWLVHAYVMY